MFLRSCIIPECEDDCRWPFYHCRKHQIAILASMLGIGFEDAEGYYEQIVTGNWLYRDRNGGDNNEILDLE